MAAAQQVGRRIWFIAGAIPVVLAAALVAFSLRFFWVKEITGWEGMVWGETYPFAILPISLIVSLSILLATDRPVPRRRLGRLACVAAIWLILLSAFEAARGDLLGIEGFGYMFRL